MEPLNGPAPGSAARVFLLIQNRLLREALVRLFRRRQDFIVVGQGSPSDPLPIGPIDFWCSVLVLDSFLPDHLRESLLTEDGLPASFKTVLIAMEPDEDQFLAAVRSGVSGYLLKDASALEVVAAVRSVSRGEAVCPPQLCSTLFRFVAQIVSEVPAPVATSKPDLTLRQQQLVSIVAKGLTNKQIASHLNISEFTVRNHIHRILKQVDAETRSEAVETIRSFGYALSQ
jgi:two-component system, NarL family, nitrate/nitrite response regulator NarL